MSLIRVYIATTDGPVEVLSITREDASLRSVVCENGRAKALPISRDYDDFTKEPTGVIEKAYKHGSFRLDLSAPITNGLSWQLGAFIAHGLLDEERLAQNNGEVDTVLWLTGEVDRNLNIQPVEHIEDKLNSSRELFESLREQNIQINCFIPSGGFIPDDEFLENLGVDGENFHLEMVRDLDRIVKFLSLNDPYLEFTVEEDDNDDLSEPIDVYKDQDPNKLVIKDNRPLKMIVLGLLLLALFGGIFMQYKDNILALRENALSIGISEIIAHPNEGCNKPETIRLDRNGQIFSSSSTSKLCALEITLNNRGTSIHMWAFAQSLDSNHLLLADREDLLQSEPRKGIIGWRLEVPPNLQKSIDYRIVGLASPYPLKDAVERLIRRQIEQPELSWDDLEKRLKEEKITVITAQHSLLAQP